ncbi:hypothetical protein EYF80_001718 [Liparis tanakae]|uniref:Uncharacterized protein n=1 Tax=Liparis tanakae TaxID=230148 RepID=A0A4Z2JDT5_9TELE|nr:hypothetical protein EYF80_001718 [Liparis tanakae]
MGQTFMFADPDCFDRQKERKEHCRQVFEVSSAVDVQRSRQPLTYHLNCCEPKVWKMTPPCDLGNGGVSADRASGAPSLSIA